VTRLAGALPALRGASKEAIAEQVRSAFERVEASGLEGALRSLGEKVEGDEAKTQVFTAAVIVQFADGHLTNEENEFLLDLADVLGS
jgi:tellurite resistance protein